jgi:hypothetical protein
MAKEIKLPVNRFTVYHYNFNNINYFPSLEEAKAFAQKSAFDATVYEDGHLVASYSAIGGWR